MSQAETPNPPPDADSGGASFMERWSRRKLHARQEGAEALEQTGPAPGPAAKELTDTDMPPLESLDERSDYSGFFSPKVSAELRRRALRKLFHSPVFNTIDKLDIYAEDYTHFEALGDTFTQEMRYRLEVEAKRLAQAVAGGISAAAESTSTPLDNDRGHEEPSGAEQAPASGAEREQQTSV